MLVSKQNIISDNNLLTHPVLLLTLLNVSLFQQNQTRNYSLGLLTQTANLFTVSDHPTEQNLYDRMILRGTVFTQLACLFHVIVNISFSYNLFIRK